MHVQMSVCLLSHFIVGVGRKTVGNFMLGIAKCIEESRMAYPSGTGLPWLFWNKGREMSVVVVVKGFVVLKS